MAEDFVQQYLPKEVVALLEAGTLTITKDSFIDEALAEHYSDLLYRADLPPKNWLRSDRKAPAHAGLGGFPAWQK